MDERRNHEEKKDAAIRNCLKEVETVLRGDVKYGAITIVIQDGIPIQLDTLEKRRF